MIGFPIWIKGVEAGPIGAIIVSGLAQLEDHQLIVRLFGVLCHPLIRPGRRHHCPTAIYPVDLPLHFAREMKSIETPSDEYPNLYSHECMILHTLQ
jgi:hypothetical protein